MYTLKTISECHPSNQLNSLLNSEIYGFKEKFLDAVLEEIVDSINNNPECVIQKSFWKKIGNKLLLEVYRIWDEIGLPKGVRDINPPEKSVTEKLDRIRKIYDIEFSELDKGYDLLYHEGNGSDSPLEIYAQNKCITTISLDKNNPAYHYLDYDDGEVDRLIQIWRESFWIEKIKGSIKINNSLLVAGKTHIDNEYGLATKLKKKNIELISVLDLEGI